MGRVHAAVVRGLLALIVVAAASSATGCLGDSTCVGTGCTPEQADGATLPDDGPADRAGDTADAGNGGADSGPGADLGDGGAVPDSGRPDAGSDTGADASPPDGVDDPADGARLEVQPRVPLPYAVAGNTVGSAPLEVYETGGQALAGALQVDVVGPFAVSGSTAPVGANETRVLTVTYTGATDAPRVALGSATVSAGDQQGVAELAAVIGRSDLASIDWTEDAYGSRGTISLPATAPFPHASASYTNSTVLIAVPAGLTDDPAVNFTIHFHGHNATVAETVASQFLVELQSLSGRDSVFVAPQGPLEAADGNFGKLMDSGGLRNLAEDVATVLYRDGFVSWPALGDVVLTSHSGGYIGTARAAQLGGMHVRAIQLYDSLYALEADYLGLIQDGILFRSTYTADGGTKDNNLALAGLLTGAGVDYGSLDSDEALAADDVIIAGTSAIHGDCMYVERRAARWEAQSGLPRRPNAPPELLLTEADGDQARIEWRADRGAAGTTWQVEGSQDGTTWEALQQSTGTTATVPLRPWLRLVATSRIHGDSAPSDVYGATGSDWLVVDGFDRVLRGSYTAPTHPFAAWTAQGLGESYSIASNEAVAEGRVSLEDYPRVLWLLGDESTADVTLSADERGFIETFLANGGQLVISGSELGYATNATWLSSVLHATYVSDDANTTTAGGFTFGVAYPEDYPDVFSGQSTVWSYATGGAAAVGWQGRIIVVGFPLETLAPASRAAAIGQLVSWLD